MHVLFLELLLTGNYLHFLQRNATSDYVVGGRLVSWLVVSGRLVFGFKKTPYIILIYHALITLSYIDFNNSIQYTFFVFTSNFFSITQLNNRINDVWDDSFWKSIWKPKISFIEMIHESLEKQFSWNLMLKHTMKLTSN